MSYKEVYMLSKKVMNKKERIKKILSDTFSPFIFIWRFIQKYYESSFKFVKDNKEIVVIISYWLWLLLQSAFLFFSFWIEWLNFLSFKFSLIILAILLFLGLLWLPIVFLFIILMFLYTIWLFFPFLLFIALLLGVLWKKFPNFFNKEKFNKIDEIIKLLYFFYTFIILIFFWISFIYQFSVSKPIELLTEKNWKIMWDLIFYNQDFYFINNCNEKIVIPNNQITWIHFLCPMIWCSSIKKKQIEVIKNNYCNIFIKNRYEW